MEQGPHSISHRGNDIRLMIILMKNTLIKLFFLNFVIWNIISKSCTDQLHLSGVGNSGLGFNFGGSFESPVSSRPGQAVSGSDILERTSHELKLEKSNILLLGPTGSGNLSISYLKLC